MIKNDKKNGQKMVKNGQKIWVFSDKDFLDWPRPPPFLTERKKKHFLCLPFAAIMSYVQFQKEWLSEYNVLILGVVSNIT